MQIKRNAGFTIVEMLIVVTILAMLAGVLIPVLEDSASTSRDARRAADLKSVQAAVEAFHRVNGLYPDTGNRWSNELGTAESYGPDGYIPDLVPEFLPALPKDPEEGTDFGSEGYAYRSDGTNFKLVAWNTPESFPVGNPFYDPQAADKNWQICTPGAYAWNRSGN